MALAGIFVLLVVLVLPLAAGITLIVLSRRGGLGYPACGACKYNLAATVGTVDRCPECGAPFVEAGILPPRGKPKPLLLWSGVALLLLPLTFIGFLSFTFSQSYNQGRANAAQLRQRALAAQQVQQSQQQADTSKPAEAESEVPAQENDASD